MYKVKMEKECGCFRRSGISAIKEFATHEKALKEAQMMCEDMNENFCGKHSFSVEAGEEIIVIKMQMAS